MAFVRWGVRNGIAQERFFPLTSSQPLCRDPIYTMAPAAAPAPTVLRELTAPRVLSVPPRPPLEQPAWDPREQPSASHHLVVRTPPPLSSLCRVHRCTHESDCRDLTPVAAASVLSPAFLRCPFPEGSIGLCEPEYIGLRSLFKGPVCAPPTPQHFPKASSPWHTHFPLPLCHAAIL
jgi:hypothetical protein